MPETRKRMSREDRRDVILEEAIEVFGRLGYRNATTSELARTAGISEALLYQHFSSKQALLIACVETLGEEIHEGLYRLLIEGEGAEDPTATFQNLYQRLLRFLTRRPEISRFSLVILAELEDSEIRDAVREVIERNVGLLRRALERGQRTGAIRGDQDPELIAWFLVGMYQLFGLLQRLDLTGRVREDALYRLIEPFLGEGAVRDGIRRPEQRPA